MKQNIKPFLISVALNVCNGLYGLIQTGQDGYMITPVDNHIHHIEAEHKLIRVNPIQRNEMVQDRHINKREVKGNLRKVNEEALTGDEEMFTWYEVDLDREMEKQDELVDLEWEGYVADKVWQVTSLSFITMNDKIIIV